MKINSRTIDAAAAIGGRMGGPALTDCQAGVERVIAAVDHSHARLTLAAALGGNMVKVASFRRYDVRTDRMVRPAYKMLVQALRPEDGYVKIEGTEEEVAIETLNQDGRYYPRK